MKNTKSLTTKNLRHALREAAIAAASWFKDQSEKHTRSDWDKRGGLRDKGNGAVYAYFGRKGVCYYIGQTTGSVKKRSLFKTSCHREQEWWSLWTSLRIVNMPNRTDQISLELLLILALKPIYNVKPARRSFKSVFSLET